MYRWESESFEVYRYDVGLHDWISIKASQILLEELFGTLIASPID